MFKSLIFLAVLVCLVAASSSQKVFEFADKNIVTTAQLYLIDGCQGSSEKFECDGSCIKYGFNNSVAVCFLKDKRLYNVFIKI